MKRRIERIDFTLIIMILVTAIFVGLLVTCCGHYAWFRWTMEAKRVELLEHEVKDSAYRLELSKIYYEDELAALRPPDINIDFIEEGGE